MNQSRPCPDFIIIGAMKAGTTTLYDYCAAHPQIGMSYLKETDFFIEEKNWRRGVNWYQSLFPVRFQYHGEASPNYTKVNSFKGVPEKILAHNPGCKLIFIARDPIQRAESQYAHAVLSRAVPNVPAKEMSDQLFSHLTDVSRYAVQIKQYLKYFPRDQMLFLEFEDFTSHPDKILKQVADFLDVRDAWGHHTHVSANNAAHLATMPGWVFAWREHPAVEAIKHYLPRNILYRGLNLVSVKPKTIPKFDEKTRSKFADALREDAVEFRKISGLDCENWTI